MRESWPDSFTIQENCPRGQFFICLTRPKYPIIKTLHSFLRRIMPVYQITINGQVVDIEAEAEMPLLWALRDLLGLTGTKYSCGMGICGTCTVLIDGQPVRSCITPVSSVTGKSILTIEGLSPDVTHPLQKAWLEEQVTQCGYCQPGQILTAAALLEKNPAPTDSDIDSAMSGVLCRCGTYQRIRKAIHRAAQEA